MSGSLFGSAQKPAFGTLPANSSFTFGLGSNATSTPFGGASQPNTGFGSTGAAGFQAPFSGFGTTTTSSGFSTVGTSFTTPAPSFSGFGSNQPAQSNLFGQTGTSNAAPSFGFGSSLSSTAAPAFGTSTAPSFSFGTGSQQKPMFGGFGSNAAATGTSSATLLC